MTSSSVNLDALRLLGWNSHCDRALARLTAATAIPFRIVEGHRDRLLLQGSAGPVTGRLTPGLQQRLAADGVALAVGDWVLTRPEPGGEPRGEHWVEARLAPYNQLRRVTPGGSRQTLVSNVDCALLVMGLDGDFNPRRLERYLALTAAAGVPARVVLTKADQYPVEPALARLGRWLPEGIRVDAVDARDPAAAVVLKDELRPGATLVLLGSSGAGKSTLTNTLCGEPLQATAEVRADDSHGRHTTTRRSLRRVPGGACVIDTPGLRGLRADVAVADLDALYGDIEVLAAGCRFRDCRHGEEPGCAVREGLSPERLAHYQKLRREVARDGADRLGRLEQKARDRVQHRAMRRFQRERRR